ncbi:putative uncharacterized protein [Tannerella sp. CAG:118]|nr:putative uncharacterized protein [Tannerella sp. CAG:118]
MVIFLLKINIYLHVNMKTKKLEIWKIIAIAIAIILMMYWLFAGTLIEEDSNETDFPSDIIEQSDN